MDRPAHFRRTIWEEPEALRRERYCRFIISTPFAIVAGGAYGYFLDASTGSGLSSGVLWGTVSFTLFFYLEHLLSPLLEEFLSWIGGEFLAGFGEFVFDATVGASVAWLVVNLLGAPTFTRLSSAVALGALYALVMGGLFCGRGLEGVISFALGTGGGSTPHRPDYSLISAMVNRGEYEAAAESYRAAVRKDPKDPVPHFRLAKLLARELGNPSEAVAVLREAREVAQLTQEEEILLFHRLIDLLRYHLAEPRKAAPELARLAELHPNTEAGKWAREELALLKAEMLDGESS